MLNMLSNQHVNFQIFTKPVGGAWKLHQSVPHSQLHVIADAGHSSAEVGIAEKLIEITNKYRISST